jgi:hypothetical protein
MSPDLQDKTWMSCGISLLWDAEALNEICTPEYVRSLREFMRLHQAGWPEDALKLINNRVLVVAGLEAAMDTLNPLEAVRLAGAKHLSGCTRFSRQRRRWWR